MKKLIAIILLSVTAFSMFAQTKINPAKLLQGTSGSGSLFLKSDNAGNVSFSNNLNGSVISGAGNATLSTDLMPLGQADGRFQPLENQRLSTSYSPQFAALYLSNNSGEQSIQIGQGPTGNRYSYIDFIGDDVYTDYGLRVIRLNTGQNAGSTIVHRGTGALTLVANESAPIIFATANSERLRVAENGNILIGNSSDNGAKLQVNGNGSVSGTLSVGNPTLGSHALNQSTGDTRYISSSQSSNIAFLNQNANFQQNVTSQKLRIGDNATPTFSLEVVGTELHKGASDYTSKKTYYTSKSIQQVVGNYIDIGSITRSGAHTQVKIYTNNHTCSSLQSAEYIIDDVFYNGATPNVWYEVPYSSISSLASGRSQHTAIDVRKNTSADTLFIRLRAKIVACTGNNFQPQIRIETNGFFTALNNTEQSSGTVVGILGNPFGAYQWAVASDNFGLQANNMVLNATGLGVNTTSPSERLHVVGNALITGTLAVGNATSSTHAINQITGDGRYLGITATATNSNQLGGQVASYYLNASNFNAGILSNTRLSSDVPLKNIDNTFNGTTILNAFYASYTSDGLFNANARPSKWITPQGLNYGLLGYSDAGYGQYVPRIGFLVVSTAYQAATKASIGVEPSSGDFTIRGGSSNTEQMRIKQDNSAIFQSTVSISNATSPEHAVRLDQAQNASNLSTGTIPDARLSFNIPFKNSSNTYTGMNYFPSNTYIAADPAAFDYAADAIYVEKNDYRVRSASFQSIMNATQANDTFAITAANPVFNISSNLVTNVDIGCYVLNVGNIELRLPSTSTYSDNQIISITTDRKVQMTQGAKFKIADSAGNSLIEIVNDFNDVLANVYEFRGGDVNVGVLNIIIQYSKKRNKWRIVSFNEYDY